MKKQQSQDEKQSFVLRHYRENSLDTEVAWHTFANRHGIRRKTAFRRYAGAVAAVLLLLIGLSGKYMMERNAAEWIAVTTGAGEYKEVWLPDSTSVSLAENTSLRYDRKTYGKEKRAVELTGKAFFEVMRDEARSFSVQTQQALITVLGTSFQLEERMESSSLYVKTGLVRFQATEAVEALLTAGMSAHYSLEKGLQVIEEEVETEANYLAWKTHQLRFRNTPLEQVIRDLCMAYQVEIVNRSPGKTALRLTSSFDNLTLDELLSVINETLDIRLEARPVN